MAFNRTSRPASKQPAITAGAYSIGDVIGELLVFDVDGENGGGNVTRLTIFDGAAQSKGIRAMIFDSQPTAIANNAAFAFGAGDWDKFCGSIEIESGDYYAVGADSVGEKGNQAVPYKSASGNLYVYLVAVEAPTFGATDDLIVSITTWKD